MKKRQRWSGRYSVYALPGTVPPRSPPFWRNGKSKSRSTTPRGSASHFLPGRMATVPTHGMIQRSRASSPDRSFLGTRSISRRTRNPSGTRRSWPMIRPNGLCSRTPMRPSLIKRPSISSSASGMADAGGLRWAKCQFSPVCCSVPIAAPSYIRSVIEAEPINRKFSSAPSTVSTRAVHPTRFTMFRLRRFCSGN